MGHKMTELVNLTRFGCLFTWDGDKGRLVVQKLCFRLQFETVTVVKKNES